MTEAAGHPPHPRRRRRAAALVATALATPILALAFPWTEAAGFTTGLLCVWLAAESDLWTWPANIATCSFYLYVFSTSGLYADAGLQVLYIAIGFYGMSRWRSGQGADPVRPVARVARREALVLAALGLAATGALGWFLSHHTPSTVPWGDASTTVLSLVAQWLMSRRFLENWVVWIAADLLYIPLYWAKDLHLTAALYLLFMALCVQGWMGWKKEMA